MHKISPLKIYNPDETPRYEAQTPQHWWLPLWYYKVPRWYRNLWYRFFPLDPKIVEDRYLVELQKIRDEFNLSYTPPNIDEAIEAAQQSWEVRKLPLNW